MSAMITEKAHFGAPIRQDPGLLSYLDKFAENPEQVFFWFHMSELREFYLTQVATKCDCKRMLMLLY